MRISWVLGSFWREMITLGDPTRKIQASPTLSQPLAAPKSCPGEQRARATFPPSELCLGADDLMTRWMDPDIAALEINTAAEGPL